MPGTHHPDPSPDDRDMHPHHQRHHEPTDRPNPYAGPARFSDERDDAEITYRPNPYAGTPDRFPDERDDAEITYRSNPYRGHPDRRPDDSEDR